MSPAATCRDRLQERMRSIWETERTGKACVRASSALGSRGEDILPPNLQDGCPSPENNPTASAHAFLELLLHSRAAFSKQRSLKPLRSCHPQECIGEDFVRGGWFPHELLPLGERACTCIPGRV